MDAKYTIKNNDGSITGSINMENVIANLDMDAIDKMVAMFKAELIDAHAKLHHTSKFRYPDPH